MESVLELLGYSYLTIHKTQGNCTVCSIMPLTTVCVSQGLQVVMKSIMRAMVPLLQVLVLTMFVILIYATVGLSFLVEKFHATCYKNDTRKDDRTKEESSDFIPLSKIKSWHLPGRVGREGGRNRVNMNRKGVREIGGIEREGGRNRVNMNRKGVREIGGIEREGGRNRVNMNRKGVREIGGIERRGTGKGYEDCRKGGGNREPLTEKY